MERHVVMSIVAVFAAQYLWHWVAFIKLAHGVEFESAHCWARVRGRMASMRVGMASNMVIDRS